MVCDKISSDTLSHQALTDKPPFNTAVSLIFAPTDSGRGMFSSLFF
jgi:hypothetical protein